jgi:hypothetical protein
MLAFPIERAFRAAGIQRVIMVIETLVDHSKGEQRERQRIVVRRQRGDACIVTITRQTTQQQSKDLSVGSLPRH